MHYSVRVEAAGLRAETRQECLEESALLLCSAQCTVPSCRGDGRRAGRWICICWAAAAEMSVECGEESPDSLVPVSIWFFISDFQFIGSCGKISKNPCSTATAKTVCCTAPQDSLVPLSSPDTLSIQSTITISYYISRNYQITFQ